MVSSGAIPGLRSFFAFLLLWLVCSPQSSAQQRSVALTFDDLPCARAAHRSEAQSVNRTILAALGRHEAPTTGFVIEEGVQEIGESPGEGILWQWIRRGHDLGNHTFSHADFNDLTVEQMEQEIALGEKSVSRALKRANRRPRYFRFPMNHTGDTRDKHDAIVAFLAQRGYAPATSTIENEDFAFNTAYLRMLAKKDAISAKRLRADYLAYTSDEIDYYAALSKQVFGYEPPEVMVLHVNRLNADMIEALLRLFEQKHYSFVTLDRAQSDPAFSTPDTFITPYGPMWGYRWAAERGVKVNGTLEAEPPAWIMKYTKEQ